MRPSPATHDLYADGGVGVISGLVRSNLESLHLAKELLAAQESADAHAVEAGLAIDAAATSDGDPAVIDAALHAVAEADAASAREADLSTSWSKHRVGVYELITAAVQLLGSLPNDSAGRAPGFEASP